MSKDEISSRLKGKIAGAIYGQFIGDALGTRYEFSSSFTTKQKIKSDLAELSHLFKKNSDGRLFIMGGGPFNVVPGQVTDDTELAMGLLCSILENKGFIRERVAEKYIKWYKSNPFDIGKTTTNALSGANTYIDIVSNARVHNESSLSNGCLMRISPLAIYGLTMTDELLLRHCCEDTIMTNPNPISIDAVGVYCIGLKTAILTSDKRVIFKAAFDAANTDIIKNILIDSLTKPDPVITTDNQYVTTDSKCIGYVGIALQNAFYELMKGTSFYDSLIKIIKRGGDTDTNGCIAGALLGAYYGVNGIPQHFISGVSIDNPRSKVYSEIDQTKIQARINLLHQLIMK